VDAQVVMISGHGNIESAVRAIKMGAFDFVEKPLSLEKTVLVVRNALRQRDARGENRALRARVDRQHDGRGEFCHAPVARAGGDGGAHQRARADLRRERHRQGTGGAHGAPVEPAPDRPFVEVNCAAIPEELIESSCSAT
jgi:two-component system, NtrC family, nitrogen regulation response regulator NtrX